MVSWFWLRTFVPMKAFPEISPLALKSPVGVVEAVLRSADMRSLAARSRATRFGSPAVHGPLSLKTCPRQPALLYLYSGLPFTSPLLMSHPTFPLLSLLLCSDHPSPTP